MGSAAPARRAGWIERPDCRRIRYEATGEGPAIVLARSRGTNLMSWLQQAAHFAPRRRCVAFSHRVLFPSTAPVSGPDPALYADDLAALVDALGLRDVRLVCPPWAAGRAWSTRCSGRGGVKPLVLLASTGSLDPRQVSEPERSRLERWDAEGAVAREGLSARGIDPAAGERMAREQPALYHLHTHMRGLNEGVDRGAVRARLHALRRRASEGFPAARCPVLFVAPEEDMMVPPLAQAAVAAAIPGARAAPLARAGHPGRFERAAAFNAPVESIFAEVGA